MSLDRNAQARDVLVELTKTDWGKNNTEAWINLGQAAYTLRDSARLRLSFARTIAIAPDRHEGYVLKGLHLQRMGDLDGAEREFRKAIERQASAENHMLLGMAQSRNNKIEKARENFQQALQIDPGNHLATALSQQPERAAQLAGATE
jgi:tetratricopeptide (TPR) repeat protein